MKLKTVSGTSSSDSGGNTRCGLPNSSIQAVRFRIKFPLITISVFLYVVKCLAQALQLLLKKGAALCFASTKRTSSGISLTDTQLQSVMRQRVHNRCCFCQ